MIFNTLTIKNFFSIDNITLPLDTNDLTLILGENRDGEGMDSNGSGKSSIVEAFVWGLYGTTIKGVKADEVINIVNNEPAEVTITFTDNGNNYVVTRRREFGKSDLLITCNDLILNRGTATRNQELLEEILGMDLDSFLNSVIFCHNYANVFTQGGDAQRKEILEKILGLEIFSHCYEEVKKEYDEINKQYAIINSNILQLQSKYDLIIKDIERINTTIEERKKEFENKKKEISYQIKEKEEEVEKYSKILENLNSELDKVNNEIQQYDLESKKQSEQIKNKLKEANAKYAEFQSTKKIIQIKIEKLQNSIDKLADQYLGKPCPTCGKIIEEKDLTKVLASSTRDLEIELGKLEETKKNVEELEIFLKQLEEEEKKYDFSQLETLLRKRGDLLKEIGNYKSLHSASFNALSTLISHKNELNLEDELQKLQEWKEEKEEELKENKNKLQQLLQEREDKEKRYKILEFWKSGFSKSGIQSWIINSYINFLNQRINEYIEALGFTGMEVCFVPTTSQKKNMEIDKLNLEIIVDGNSMSYNSCSSGEKRRIDIAVLFAIQDLIRSRKSKEVNVFFYDEIFDTLDDNGCENLISLLKEIHQDSTVFVISHNNGLKQYFDDTLLIVKDGGLSNLAIS